MTGTHHLLSPQKDFFFIRKGNNPEWYSHQHRSARGAGRAEDWCGSKKNALNATGCSVCVSHWVVSDSWRPHGLKLTRLLWPWNCLGKNTGVGCNSLLQGSRTQVSLTVGRFFTIWATREAPINCIWLTKCNNSWCNTNKILRIPCPLLMTS